MWATVFKREPHCDVIRDPGQELSLCTALTAPRWRHVEWTNVRSRGLRLEITGL
jgi:hypothetical protein